MYAFTARCIYVHRIGLRGLGVVPTVDIAHYEYHYLSSCACAENRAIAPLMCVQEVNESVCKRLMCEIYCVQEVNV